MHGRLAVTPSLYESTTDPQVLRAQGCRAARGRTNGLVVLDFGMLDYRRPGGYGTLTFGSRFAPLRSIGRAGRSYAEGYSDCLPRGSSAQVTLVLGTSNYRQEVPSTYTAGRLWSAQTAQLGSYLRRHHLDHVTAAAGDDVEPAWDPDFRRTYDFFRGYGAAHIPYYLFDYGSLDGGVGGFWNLRQAYYVAGGMHAARAIPEIYNRAMAKQWAELSRLSAQRYGRPVRITGLMTQHSPRCRSCGYTAAQAHRALVGELAKGTKAPSRSLASVTNIGTPAPFTPMDLPQHGR